MYKTENPPAKTVSSFFISFTTLLFFLFAATLYAEAPPEMLFKHEAFLGSLPSTYVHNVNVIRGTYSDSVVDCTIPGPEPIPLHRTYETTFLSDIESPPSGIPDWTGTSTQLYYGPRYQDRPSHTLLSVPITTGASFCFFESGSPKHDRQPFVPISSGITNCSSEELSAKTNLLNQQVSFSRGKDVIFITSGDGTKKVFVKHLTKTNYYPLVEETRPSGNKVHYEYDNKNRIARISTTNATNSRTFGWVKFHFTTGQPTIFEMSDGRKIETIVESPKRKIPRVRAIIPPESPSEQYLYDDDYYKQGGYTRFLRRVDNPDGRYLLIDYEFGRKNPSSYGRVQELKAPVGKDASPITLYRFSYDVAIRKERHYRLFNGGRTSVDDALGRRTVYVYDHRKFITAIERLARDSNGSYKVAKKERFFWSEGNPIQRGRLTSYVIEDGNGNIAACRTFSYDARGNVLKETLWGRLTGDNNHPIVLNNEGIPIDNGVERYEKVFRYSDDGFNNMLSAHDGNKATHYVYKPGTNLVTKTLFYESNNIRLRTFYEYDNDAMLTKTVHDDGNTPDPANLAGVTQHHITLITPCKEMAGMGKPTVVEQRAIDTATGANILVSKIVNHYSPQHRVIREDHYDANNVLRYSIHRTYDSFGHIVMETDPYGNTKRFRYDANANKIEEHGPLPGHHARYCYDFANRLTKKEEIVPNASTLVEEYDYDYMGNRTAITDTSKNTSHTIYDDFNRPITVIKPPVVNVDGHVYRPTIHRGYDLFDRISSERDERGFVTKTEYNLRGQPTRIDRPDGTVELFRYHPNGDLRKQKASDDTYTEYFYDYLSRVTETRTYHPNKQLLHTKHASYSAFHKTSITDANGNSTHFEYDHAGREKAVTTKTGKKTFHYDALGNMTKELIWHGASADDWTATSMTYDLLGRVVEKRIEDKNNILQKEQYQYDPLGHKTASIIFPNNIAAATKIAYAPSGDILSTTDPLGNTSRFLLNYHYNNALGQQVLQRTAIDPQGTTAITTYDAIGRAVEIETKSATGTALAHRRSYYDAANNCVKEEEKIINNGDAVATLTNLFSYNSMNRIEIRTEAAGTALQRQTKYHYSVRGQLDMKTRPDGTHIHYQYHQEGMLATKRSSNDTLSYQYHYDKEKQLTQIDDLANKKKSRLWYDTAGNVEKEEIANGLTVTRKYDRANRPIILTLPNQTHIYWEYTGHGLKALSKANANGEILYKHTITARDLASLPLKEELAANTGIVERSWNPLGKTRDNTSPFFSEQLAYNAVGNVVTRAANDPIGNISAQYSYDLLHQLIQETGATPNSYQYDSMQNRTKKNGATYNKNIRNELLSDGAYQYIYDANGNIVQKQTGAQSIQYRYDPLNRLVEAEEEKNIKIVFSYDPFDRRTSKTTYQWKGEGWQEIAHLNFLYDGQKEIGATDSKGNIVELRLIDSTAPAETGATKVVELDGNPYAAINDYKGNITALVDLKTKKIAESYRYSAFGEERLYNTQQQQQKHSALANPWRFASKRTDDELQLVYFGKRYYSPSIGQWTTLDPQGDIDGSNLYTYVHNNPLSLSDPFGTFSISDAVKGFRRTLQIPKNIMGRFLQITGRNFVVAPHADKAIEATGSFLQGQGFNYTPVERSRTGVVGQGEISRYASIAYINGMLTSYSECIGSAEFVSTKHDNNDIHFYYLKTNGLQKDLGFALYNKAIGGNHEDVRGLVNLWRDRFSEMNPGGNIHHICMSLGCTITNLGLQQLTPDERQHMHILAIAPATIIEPKQAASVHNVIHRNDAIPITDPIGYAKARFTHPAHVQLVGKLSLHPLPFTSHSFNNPDYQQVIREKGEAFIRTYGEAK
ncbi:RHS repeat protein [Simkania negevensis]|uniref:RHS repeat protein n=1 Tax=Simkania negevensis TaxID=83561 RepID=A0ABS3AUY4_9BACT|nr:RHS repeat protein [Simkania negevensis]